MKWMRSFLILTFLFLLGVLITYAQSDEAAGPALPDRSYKLLSEDEDWSYLCDAVLRQEF